MPKSVKSKRGNGTKVQYQNDRRRATVFMVVRDRDRDNTDIFTIILTFGFMMWIILCLLILTK